MYNGGTLGFQGKSLANTTKTGITVHIIYGYSPPLVLPCTYVKSELFTLVLIMLLIFMHTVHMDPPMLYVLTLSILLHTTVYTVQ